MAYYSRNEQETLYNFCPIDNRWRIYSTYPPHIRQLLERAEIIRKETDDDDDGRIVAVDGYVNRNQIRIFKPLK